MSRYRFVEAEKGRYPVTRLCRMAQVSRAAYYQWQEGAVSGRQAADAALTAAIKAIHAASRGQYGVPRVLAELRAQGYDVGRKRVARLMAAAGLRGRRPPRWVRTTTPEPTPAAIPDRVHGQFTASAPDVLWVRDITYVRTWEGWLYLATVLDVFSRRLIGWAVTDHLRASLVCAALRMAVATRGGQVARVIFHSDRGCQGAPIGVMHQAGTRLAMPQGHGQRVDGQLARDPVVQRPADDAAGEQVEDHDEVQPARARPEVRDVGHPRRVRRRSRELAIEHVRGAGQPVLRVRRALETPLLPGPQALLPHETRYAMPPDVMPLRLEFPIDARTPIAPPTRSMRRGHVHRELLILAPPAATGRWCAA
jgi:hypothetical protein